MSIDNLNELCKSACGSLIFHSKSHFHFMRAGTTREPVETKDYRSFATHRAARSFYQSRSRFPDLKPQPTSTVLIPLADGPVGTFKSLEAMAMCVRGEIPPDYSGYQDQFNREAAIRICETNGGWDAQTRIAALFDFAAHHIRYVVHPPNEQRVQDCRRTIELGEGDCVSKSVCLATLLAALGYRPRFVAQCLDGRDYTHVYCEVQQGEGNWFALDPIAEDQPMGWRQPVLDGGWETPWEIF